MFSYHPINLPPETSMDLLFKSSNSKRLSGIIIDSNFAFEEHVHSLCRIASQNLRALSRISQCLSQKRSELR